LSFYLFQSKAFQLRALHFLELEARSLADDCELPALALFIAYSTFTNYLCSNSIYTLYQCCETGAGGAVIKLSSGAIIMNYGSGSVPDYFIKDLKKYYI
jgi:hypothetical protein